MSDPLVERWRQRGDIFMWKSKSPRWPEWNITASDLACDTLNDLFDRMENGQYSSKKELLLAKPAIMPHCSGPFRLATHWTIKYPKGTVPDGEWVFQEQGSQLFLVLGLSRLRELREAIADMNKGGGDYSIGGDENRLWIWWYFREMSNPA
jgi:hypothetical protein